MVSPVHQHWRYLSLALSCQNGSCDATDLTSCGTHITSIRRTAGLGKHQNRNMLNWSIWSTHKTHHATRTPEELIAECHAEINHQPFRPLASLSLICLLWWHVWQIASFRRDPWWAPAVQFDLRPAEINSSQYTNKVRSIYIIEKLQVRSWN